MAKTKKAAAPYKAPVKKAGSVSTPIAGMSTPLKAKDNSKEGIQKAAMLEAIRLRLLAMELPKELQLSPHEKITDVTKFFDAHLAVVLRNSSDTYKPYSDRLKQALAMVGIDIKEVLKTLKAEEFKKTQDGESEKKQD
jgi:hypothetical protein